MKVPPGLFARMSPAHQEFFRTAVGLRMYEDFLTQYGKHIFTFGTTGSGKSNKGIWLVDLLHYLELQVWFDTGKTNEILPLLCLGLKVRIIVPTGTTIEIQERRGGKWERIPNHPEIIQVSNPNDALSSIAAGSWNGSRNRVRDTLTIISFRNGFSHKEIAVAWVAEFFEILAERCRMGTMPAIFPCTIHIDESQWAMAGKRISGEGERNKASEVITENALELRSSRVRLALYAQSYKNIPPAARENMLFHLVCKGGMVTPEENGNVSKWCRNAEWRDPPTPMQYKVYHGRFIFENGDSFPPLRPWRFRLYPVQERDREWIAHCRVIYEGKHDQRNGEEEDAEELLPVMGRFSWMAIPPEKGEPIPSRYETGGITDEG